MQQVEDLRCRECGSQQVYYPEVHRLDGNRKRNSPSNLVLVCPRCHTHFIFRFNHEDILILKIRGLSNAEIGRFLGISRERVRQIANRERVELDALSGHKTLDELVKLIQNRQEELMRAQKLREEELRYEEEEFEASKGELGETDLKEWEEYLADMRRTTEMLKRRRISKRGLKKRIALYIEGNESEKRR